MGTTRTMCVNAGIRGYTGTSSYAMKTFGPTFCTTSYGSAALEAEEEQSESSEVYTGTVLRRSKCWCLARTDEWGIFSTGEKSLSERFRVGDSGGEKSEESGSSSRSSELELFALEDASPGRSRELSKEGVDGAERTCIILVRGLRSVLGRRSRNSSRRCFSAWSDPLWENIEEA
jgi:hypothetical protein